MKIGINLKGSREDYIGGLKGVKRKYKCCNGILLSKKNKQKSCHLIDTYNNNK